MPHHDTTARPPRRRSSRTPRRLVCSLAAFAVALGLAIAPLGTGSTPAHAAGGKKTLTVAVSQSVDSLSPFLAVSLVSTNLMRLQYDFLTNYDPKNPNKVIPGLATDWKSSPDKLTWTYRIRGNAKWSDGRKVTADDAAFTFSKMMTDDGAATANGNFVENFRKVSAPDPRTLVIELKKPQATMLALDVPIVPEHVWGKVGDYAKFNNDTTFPIVGDGPFQITDFKTDQYVKLTANPHFWRGKPGFDQLVFKYYKDADAAVSALQKGEVSFVSGLTPAQANQLKSQPDVKLNNAAGKRFWALATNPGAKARNGEEFGNGNKALLDPRVRKALFAAVDRKAIVDKVLQGYGVEGQGYIPPMFSRYFWKPAAGQKVAYDPEKAARLLDRAGYRMKGGKRVGKDGKPLTFRLLCHSTDPKDKAAGKYIEEWWGKLGIGTELDCRDNVSDPWLAGDYDIAFDGWSVNPDPDYVLSIHTCDALPGTPEDTGLTDNFICDKKFDELYGKQMRTYDPAKRARYVKQMESRLYDTGYMNVLAYPNSVEAYRTDQIASITSMPAGNGPIWGQDGYWSWWSAKPAGGDAKASSSGSSTGLVIGIVVAAVVVLGAGGFVTMRRRSTAEDRE